jgi:hypothetical protein
MKSARRRIELQTKTLVGAAKWWKRDTTAAESQEMKVLVGRNKVVVDRN